MLYCRRGDGAAPGHRCPEEPPEWVGIPRFAPGLISAPLAFSQLRCTECSLLWTLCVQAPTVQVQLCSACLAQDVRCMKATVRALVDVEFLDVFNILSQGPSELLLAVELDCKAGEAMLEHSLVCF